MEKDTCWLHKIKNIESTDEEDKTLGHVISWMFMFSSLTALIDAKTIEKTIQTKQGAQKPIRNSGLLCHNLLSLPNVLFLCGLSIPFLH